MVSRSSPRWSVCIISNVARLTLHLNLMRCQGCKRETRPRPPLRPWRTRGTSVPDATAAVQGTEAGLQEGQQGEALHWVENLFSRILLGHNVNRGWSTLLAVCTRSKYHYMPLFYWLERKISNHVILLLFFKNRLQHNLSLEDIPVQVDKVSLLYSSF